MPHTLFRQPPWGPHHLPPWCGPTLALTLVACLGAGLCPPQASAKPPQGSCAPPQPGRYAVIGEGELKGEPLARLLLETWNSDGSLTGVRLERRGRSYRESTYTGQFRPLTNCRVGIERTYLSTVSTSQAVLDPQGRPRFSLGVLPDVLMLSRWISQPQQRCSVSLLDGVILSQQQGKDWRDQQWQANAVLQREEWRNGQVKGLAISSFGPTVQEATYRGSITVQPDCLATIQQTDSLGKTYNYRAIVLADGSGYLYLQTDPDDVTVAILERVAKGLSAQPAW